MKNRIKDLDNIIHRIENEDRYDQTRDRIKILYSVVSKTEELSKNKETIERALDLMLFAHFSQKDRPDGQPYINHPLDVALHVANEYHIYEPDLIVAALLHDTVEDQAKNILVWGNRKLDEQESLEIQALQIVNEHFGKNVAELVRELTNPDFDAKAKKLSKNVNEEEKLKLQYYLQHFEGIYNDNAWAFAIKMADFSQNALHLDVLEESPRKDWFRRKYGPVILMIVQKLKNLENKSHPLCDVKEAISKTLIDVYERDYR